MSNYDIDDLRRRVARLEAAQSPAESKPGVVSKDIRDKAYFAYYAAMNGGRGDLESMHHALNAVAPLICAAKDADTRTVIADNDAKMDTIDDLRVRLGVANLELTNLKRALNNWRNEVGAKQSHIDRLQGELEFEKDIVSRIWNILGAPSYKDLAGRAIYDLVLELKAQAESLRHPDITSLMEKIRFRVTVIHDSGAPAHSTGELSPMSARRIIEALFSPDKP